MVQIIIKAVSEESELEGIAALQRANLRKNLSAEEAEREGFVTAEYSLDFLRKMHEAAPSVIAKDGNNVVGYALVTLREAAVGHELLTELFRAIDECIYRGKLMAEQRYVVVGQLCVGSGFRGLGLATRMYNQFRAQMQQRFDYAVTDVATANHRSLKAHLKAGFQVISSLNYGGESWDIVLWDWSSANGSESSNLHGSIS